MDEDVTDSAVRRLLFDAGDDVDDLMLLVRADVTSKNARRVRRYLARLRPRRGQDGRGGGEATACAPSSRPSRATRSWSALGLREGIAVGILKEWVREAILEGEVPNEHDAAWAYVERQRTTPSAAPSCSTRCSARSAAPRSAPSAPSRTPSSGTTCPGEAEALAYLQQVKDDALADSKA